MSSHHSDIAIKVESLSKCYHIYDRPIDRLKQMVLGRWRQYYREFWALKDVSFEVKKGETVGIIGRNGSGKSTLLQLICGTLTPTYGTVETQGRIAALLELGSGFNPEFTGRENVYMNGAILGLTKAEIDHHFDDIAAFADIGDFIERPVKTYSSGMMVRLAFAVIAHVDADILIVDEALSVGDAFFTQKCMRFLRCFQDNGGTILFVSHDTGAVVNLCNKAFLLVQGKINGSGMPKEVLMRYLAALNTASRTIDALWDKKNAVDDKSVLCEGSAIEMLKETTASLSPDGFASKTNLLSFGTGDAKITSVRLFDQNGTSLVAVEGGELVVLEVQALANKDIASAIIGFTLKDRLGQSICGYNTWQHGLLLQIRCDQTLNVKFEFQMPVLAKGDYSFDVALAEGTQLIHIQHHWAYDALIIQATPKMECFGLIGVSMRNLIYNYSNE